MPSRTRIARLLVLTVLGFGLAGALASAPAATAAAYTVTKTTDTNDGVCDADCSLREAVAAANAAPNPDTITLPPGIYLITGIEISLTSPITLTGALSTTTIIASRGWNAGTLYVPAGGLAVIANVTLMGGDNTFGGGLSNAGTLTLVDSIVRHNTGVVAGGIV
ncbi:MAG: CSLREA domain-containing protein, partial [Anaerolineales bacterium]|nr:CSLREA domain-containing protein [Anaerolineales bacterium]